MLLPLLLVGALLRDMLLLDDEPEKLLLDGELLRETLPLLREGEKVRLGVEKFLLVLLPLRICGALLPLLCGRLPTVERVLLSRLLPMNPLLLPTLPDGLLERVPTPSRLPLGRLFTGPRFMLLPLRLIPLLLPSTLPLLVGAAIRSSPRPPVLRLKCPLWLR